MKQQPPLTTSNYGEACDSLRSGYVKYVRLSQNIGNDEFFRTVPGWCDVGAKIKKGGKSFAISLKGFPVPPQQQYHRDSFIIPACKNEPFDSSFRLFYVLSRC